jgi:hypothetical protein
MKSVLTTLLSSQSVDGVIGLTLGSDLTNESDGGGGLEGDTVGVDVGDGELDGGVVLGVDESASGRALSGDVKVDEDTLYDTT